MNDSNTDDLQDCGCAIAILICVGLIGYFIGSAVTRKAMEQILLNSANSAAKMSVVAMNFAQQDYLENNRYKHGNASTDIFAKDIDKLGLGIAPDTEYYKYLLRVTDSGSFHYAIANKKKLKGYIGAVFMVETASSGTSVILCKTTDPGQIIPAEPQMENGVPTCGTGTEEF
ncbi:MAG: type IV pilin-like G/H family protein [Hormoscilla sp.]